MSLRQRCLRCLLALGFCIAFLGGSPAHAASGTVAPAQGTTGTRFNFTASGFTAGERIDFWVTAPSGDSIPRYPSVAADAAGQVVWSWDVPERVEAGTWTMIARGVQSDLRVPIAFEIVATSAAAPALSVTPTSGAPGTTFAFTASGFSAGERVGAWLIRPDSQPVELIRPEDPQLFANNDGQASWNWTAPADAPGGAWQATARGVESGVERTATFTIAAGEGPAREQGVTPASGGPGTTFTFVATGFNSGEQVGAWLNRPDRGQIDATPWLFADDQGRATWTWTAPADAPGGNWSAVALGRDSRVEVVIAFTLTGSTPAETPMPSGSVTPASGPPGTTFTFTVANFAPNETVFYWAANPDGTPLPNNAEARADANGQASWSWTAPENAPSGDWIMSARGLSTYRESQIRFSISAQPAAAAPFTVTPASGEPGTTFTFTASRFNVIEFLDVWVDEPESTVLAGPANVRANGQGVAEWSWTAPEDALGGAWRMIALGRDSQVQYIIPFEITRSEAPQPATTYSVTPSSGPPGTTFTFSAAGFVAGEKVGYWTTTPDGAIIPSGKEAVADADGRISWSWTAPEDAQPGLWLMIARSSQSDDVNNDVLYSIPFTIE